MSQDEEDRDQTGLGSERFWKTPNTLDAETAPDTAPASEEPLPEEDDG